MKTKPTSKDKREMASASDEPWQQAIYFQHHKPKQFAELEPYHFHPSIEINYLEDCDMIYSFSGEQVHVKSGHLCVFWAAFPHRVTKVIGDGSITNAYVSLSEFLSWRLPASFLNTLLGGTIICTLREHKTDRMLTARWTRELEEYGTHWQRVHTLEMQSRLHRMAIEGWDELFKPKENVTRKVIGGKALLQFEKMLRFVSENFSDSIENTHVADAGGVSINHAIILFRKMLGQTIKSTITDIRIAHAKMLLLQSNGKILTIAMDCGFNSQSAFYEAFNKATGISPAAFRRDVRASL